MLVLQINKLSCNVVIITHLVSCESNHPGVVTMVGRVVSVSVSCHRGQWSAIVSSMMTMKVSNSGDLRNIYSHRAVTIISNTAATQQYQCWS